MPRIITDNRRHGKSNERRCGRPLPRWGDLLVGGSHRGVDSGRGVIEHRARVVAGHAEVVGGAAHVRGEIDAPLLTDVRQALAHPVVHLDGDVRQLELHRGTPRFVRGLSSTVEPGRVYRHLRLAMVVLVAFLAASVVFARLSATCLQSTISDYYFTSAHPVFIDAICALGACLIVYQGSSNTEDALLNFSGFLAFVVALVPTARPNRCAPTLPEGYD